MNAYNSKRCKELPKSIVCDDFFEGTFYNAYFRLKSKLNGLGLIGIECCHMIEPRNIKQISQVLGINFPMVQRGFGLHSISDSKVCRT